MLTEQQKEKAVKQLKLQFNGALQVFNMYGLGEYIPSVVEVLAELSLLCHKRLTGQDIPITLEHANGKLRQRYKG